jgi:hypothetical protein
MRRLLATSFLVAAIVLAVSGGAGAANSQTFTDPTGDAGGGPDITSVTVSNNDQGLITHHTVIAGGITANRYHEVFYDVPPISSDDTSDYLFALETFPPTSSVTVYRWNGTSWVELVPQPAYTIDSPPTNPRYVFNRSVIGSPAYFYTRTVTYHEDASLADSRGWDLYNVDNQPNTTITSGPSGTSASSSATFTYASVEAGSTFECSLDSAAFANCSSAGVTYANLPDGLRNFRVRAKDGGGNLDATPDSRSWTVDTTPPDTTITSSPPSSTTNRAASFAFSSEAGATFECSLDNGLFTACSSPAGYSNLALGARNFRVRAKDAAGNVDQSPASRSWTVTPPGCEFEVKSGWMTPDPPQAGKRVVVGANFVCSQGKKPVLTGGTKCTGKLGSKRLVGKASRSGGTRSCAFNIPANAAGKRFTGSVKLTAGDYWASRQYVVKVSLGGRLALVGPTTKPSAPLAGQQFQAGLRVFLSRGGGRVAIKAGAVSCSATAGGKTLPVDFKGFTSLALCAWDVPSTARGSTFVATIRVVARGLTASKTFSFRIR